MEVGWGILNTIQLERRGEPMMNDKTHNGEGGGRIVMRNITYLIKILKKTEGMLSSKRGGEREGDKEIVIA